MIDVPKEFKPIINTVYPKHNQIEYERWFDLNYTGDVSDREYLPIYWCGYQVNYNYGQDKAAMQRLQDFVDSLPNDKKYFTISQYDDGVGVDWKGKDVLEFNMSKNTGYPLPLISQPHPYHFDIPKTIFANFIGSITHPIRETAFNLYKKHDYYISKIPHDIDSFCKILAQSTFTLCYRGYGATSFRLMEAMQFGSIPVYISDEFIIPHNIPFNKYGVLVKESDIDILHEILMSYTKDEIKKLQEEGRKVYEEGYTYQGCMQKILEHLRNAD